jgi:hypothetical protein
MSYLKTNQQLMASFEGLSTRHLLERGVIGQVTDDTPVAIRMKYVGKGVVTSVTVVTATSLVTITTGTGEGTKTYNFASYTTVGALVAAINSDGIFMARTLDTLNSFASALAFIATAYTVTSEGYYDILNDASGAGSLNMGYCLTYDRAPDVNVKLRMGHRVHLQEIQYKVTFGGGVDAQGIRVYSRDLQSGLETLVYTALPVDNTLTTINWASGQGKLTSGENKELIAMAIDATSVTGVFTVTGIAE